MEDLGITDMLTAINGTATVVIMLQGQLTMPLQHHVSCNLINCRLLLTSSHIGLRVTDKASHYFAVNDRKMLSLALAVSNC